MSHNKENILKVVLAMESGEFEQDFEDLHSRAGCFCAMGVAAEVYRREHGIPEEEFWIPIYTWGEDNLETLLGYSLKYPDGRSGAIDLTPPIQQWLGINSGDFYTTDNSSIMVLNDKYRMPLPQIAKKIREAYL